MLMRFVAGLIAVGWLSGCVDPGLSDDVKVLKQEVAALHAELGRVAVDSGGFFYAGIDPGLEYSVYDLEFSNDNYSLDVSFGLNLRVTNEFFPLQSLELILRFDLLGPDGSVYKTLTHYQNLDAPVGAFSIKDSLYGKDRLRDWAGFSVRLRDYRWLPITAFKPTVAVK